MKILYLVRHAKSSWDYPELNDFERPLNKRGKKDAPLMGKVLNNKKIMPNLIISSPATRAYTTARIIAENLNYPIEKIEIAEQIYESSAADLMGFVKTFSDDYQAVMMIGHNPSLTLLNNYLSDKYLDNIPTCAISALKFNVVKWIEIETESGESIFFDYPKKHKKKKRFD